MTVDWEHELERLTAQIEEIRRGVDHAAAARTPVEVPAVAEFVLGSTYLAQRKIYPRQLTLLKAIFCDLEGLTGYDHQVIAEWSDGFERPPHTPGSTVRHWQPASGHPHTAGTPGDLLRRIQHMRATGRRWMREPNLVMGRRAGKGHVGSIVAARLIYELLALGDPQDYFGMAPSKRLVIPIFAGNRQHAEFNLFADVATMIVEAPCFRPYVVKLTRDRLVLATPADLARPDRAFEGSIEIQAKEATAGAGRGIATPFQFYDEMAFIDPATSAASAESIYRGATPAMDQFGSWAMVAELSSPDQQLGEFYAIHMRGREVDPATGDAAYPETFTLQLASWDTYRDAEIATTIPVTTEEQAAQSRGLRGADERPLTFPDPGPPICAYDDQMRQLERADPIAFDVERRSQWATVDRPYLPAYVVTRVFQPWPGDEPLHHRQGGRLSNSYVMVLDPAQLHDAFAVVVGHLEPEDEEGKHHVVVDLAYRYLPADYGGELDLVSVLDRIEADARAFDARIVTDQYGGGFVTQDLNRRLTGARLGGYLPVQQLARTRDRNLQTASAFREALFLQQVHAPPMPEMELELRFLREHHGKVAAPTSGPVQTDDLAVALMVLVEQLLGDAGGQHIRDALGGLSLRGRQARTLEPVHQELADFGHTAPRTRVGERTRRAGPKRLPPWAGGSRR